MPPSTGSTVQSGQPGMGTLTGGFSLAHPQAEVSKGRQLSSKADLHSSRGPEGEPGAECFLSILLSSRVRLVMSVGRPGRWNNRPRCHEQPRGLCWKLGPRNERGSRRGLEMEGAPRPGTARGGGDRPRGGPGSCGARALFPRPQGADSSATRVTDKRSLATTGS